MKAYLLKWIAKDENLAQQPGFTGYTLVYAESFYLACEKLENEINVTQQNYIIKGATTE